MAEAARKIDPDPHGYFADQHVWALEQARLLRAGQFADVDIEHVAEEIALVGKDYKRAIKSDLAIVIEHLLKLELSNAPYPRAGWKRSVDNARRDIAWAVKETPSLHAYPQQVFDEAHEAGLCAASESLELHGELTKEIAAVLWERRYTMDQALREKWYPTPRP